jgi:hypothetical protein
MSKKFKGKTCAYCGEREAITGDHVFAREFFLPSDRADLPQAPICVASAITRNQNWNIT